MWRSTAVLWLWHLPAAYDLALGNIAVYWLMQASLLGTAVAFWASVLHPAQPPHLAIMATLGAFVQMALLGALLTFAPDGLYAIHTTAPMAFGLSQLADQQLGGLIMWIPAGLPFLVIIGLIGRRRMAQTGGIGMTAFDAIIPHLKALHVGFMAVWIAGLAALPAMLARHDRAIGQGDFARIRRATHYGYIWFLTPAAVLTVATGTTLIFLRDVFTGWMFVKLVGVAGLVTVHAWVGHTIVAVAETEGGRGWYPSVVLIRGVQRNPTEVPASDFTLLRGFLIEGELADSFASDDVRMRFNPGFTLNSTEAPVWLVFEANLSTDSPSSLALQIEAQAGTPGLTATTEAWNWNTSTFDVVDVSATSFDIDTVITPALTPSDHVQSGSRRGTLAAWMAQELALRLQLPMGNTLGPVRLGSRVKGRNRGRVQ